jgi:hypothetical protein
MKDEAEPEPSVDEDALQEQRIERSMRNEHLYQSQLAKSPVGFPPAVDPMAELERVRRELDRVTRQRDRAYRAIAKVEAAVENPSGTPLGSITMPLALAYGPDDLDEFERVVNAPED